MNNLPKSQSLVSDALVRECAEAAGLETDLWDMGAASLVYYGDVKGIPRRELVEFARMVVRRAAEAVAPMGADNDSPGSDEQAESASPSVLLIRGEK